MSHQQDPPENFGQSPGCDPKTTNKRNSGLFAFLKWFKPSTSRESIDTEDSSSCDSLNSAHSTGTVASFSYVQPNAYPAKITEKCIVVEPETDTYKARLKQRDKRRENDKNLTLRKKYNLFFQRDIFKFSSAKDEESSKSLPLMTRAMDEERQEKAHRRTNSESSKTKRAGAYLHVKGKRRAPQPPNSSQSTLSLRRKKRLAPTPPAEILFNDSLRLDHGILRPAKEDNNNSATSSARSSFIAVEAPVSPRPWYKRHNTKVNRESSHKYEPVECLPEVQFVRNSTIDLSPEEIPPTAVTITTTKSNASNSKKLEEKRKSGMSFLLTNISELDREASEIVKKEHQKNGHQELEEIPQFMRPKEEVKPTDSWISPKRRSAKDLIAKFNAITNVTKVTVNSAFFGSSSGQNSNNARSYFGSKRASSMGEERKQEQLLDAHKKRIEEIDRKVNGSLMKSESASAIKAKPETPKLERKSWNCPKCSLENEYWRIICHVCSSIKPYFDDFSSPTPCNKDDSNCNKVTGSPEKFLERSKTQIGFSALASYNLNKNKQKIIDEKNSSNNKEPDNNNKNEEREKLKKMLIEMKNSLPKRKSNILLKQNSNNRASVIVENPETDAETVKDEVKNKTQEEQIAEILIGTSETIYENIKVKKSDQLVPIKISTSAQTTVVKKASPSPGNLQSILSVKKTVLPTQPNFELMRPKDFETIYSDTNNHSAARIYANLARNDELSLFFNMPKNFAEMKNNFAKADVNTDTIEVNRLLRRLESSIAKGEMTEASIFAKELAQLKVNCSVIRQKPATAAKKLGFNIEMFVEDKISHRGPFTLEVTENQTVAELKLQVQQEFEIPVNVQRWILGKELATTDSATLKDHKITTERCPVFLYLVAPVDALKKGDDVVASTSKINQDNEPESEIILDRIPKIVEVIPKVAEPVPKIEVVDQVERPRKSLVEFKEVKVEKIEVKSVPVETLKVPNKAKIDDGFDDDATLKPIKEWECHLCTLLNSVSTNVCAVCATVRRQESPQAKKSLKKNKAPQPRKDQTYLQLVNLDNADLVENTEPFECLVCFSEIKRGDGVTLRECLHQFCKFCLANTVEYTEDAEVKCPYRDDQYSCNIALQDREIKSLVSPQVYENYLAKSVSEAENKIGKSFHCKTPDCRGWCIFEDNVNEFRCPVCRRVNCLTCQAIHSGMNCKQYQEKITQESEVDEDARRTKDMVDEMVRKGEALTCPTCQVILMKKWGCDWVRCSMCKTEICWVTRGPRWGPGGKGDTTGGCQCGVNGVKCHPQCSYCH